MKHPALILALLTALSATAAEPTPRHLFLDPAFLHKTTNATLHVNPPQKRERVINHDKPWEQLMITFFLSMFEEQGKLRLWYTCRDKDNQPNVAYAESTDGIHWIKPNLGIVDYHGSKDNNLTGLTSLEGVVFRDPNTPPAERYIYLTHLIEEGMVRFHSPDGLHWQRDNEPLIRLGADTQNVTFWDERLKKYALYLRGWKLNPDDKKKYRRVVRAELPSLTTPLPIDATEKNLKFWGPGKTATFADEFPVVFAADKDDPANVDVYNLPALPYPLDPRWYVAFPSLFQREKGTSDGRLEIQFTGSTDGSTWHRYDRAPYVPPGLDSSDSASMSYMGTGMVVRGDEIWQYATSLHFRHGDKESRKTQTDGVIYRYVQRVDGFVSLDFPATGGEAITAPVKITGDKLALNIDTGALGVLRVGLQEADGKAVPGFSVDDAVPLRINATGVAASWRGGASLASLQGRDLRVVLAGSRAKVFSFSFPSQP